jgi:hypothetical protein
MYFERESDSLGCHICSWKSVFGLIGSAKESKQPILERLSEGDGSMKKRGKFDKAGKSRMIDARGPLDDGILHISAKLKLKFEPTERTTLK